MDAMTGDLTRRLARQLGAARAWVAAAGPDEVLAAVEAIVPRDDVVAPLGGTPLRCEDLRLLGRQAREACRALVVCSDLAGPWGCAAVRLGAHLALMPLDGVGTVVGISRDAERCLPGISLRIDSLAQAEDGPAAEACAREEALWHVTSDAAQVVASYLRCHPRVTQVRYPGLKGDPSFEVAARTLQGGFGPLVDYLLQGEAHWQRLRCDDTPVREQVLAVEALLSHG